MDKNAWLEILKTVEAEMVNELDDSTFEDGEIRAGVQIIASIMVRLKDSEAHLAACEAERDALREAARPIPVDERLPKTNENVLLFNGDVWFEGYHVDGFRQWNSASGVYFHTDRYAWITHWMPLPKTPTP